MPVCVVAGAGPGNGAAIGRRFSDAGFDVALLARREKEVESLAAQIAGAVPFCCDLADEDSVRSSFAAIRDDLGEVDVLIYNAGSGSVGDIEHTTPEQLESAWRVNTLGCLLASQACIPGMLKSGAGSIIVIGATASLRGGAKFTAFASSKAAQRSLAQSMARQVGPQGIHVAYVIIDAVVDTPRTRSFFPAEPDAFYAQPSDIAESVFQLSRQSPSAWTFELDLRPFGERW